MSQKSLFRRMGGLIVISVAVMAVFLMRLVQIQLVQGEDYLNEAQKVNNYLFRIPAARGEIVDIYGRPLATNSQGYSLAINQLMLTVDVNEMLYELVDILQKNGDTWNDSTPISQLEDGHYSFINEDNEQALARQSTMKERLGLQQYATADQVVAALVTLYKLDDYPVEWQRVLGGIRYQMQLEDFGASNNFTLATDLSESSVATVKERGLSAIGADIVETSYRTYDDGTIAPHILGSVGQIFSEEWRVTDEDGNTTYPLKEKGYKMNDLIGRNGLERIGENNLRGTDGLKQVSRDKNGNIISSEVVKQPEPGKTMVLTIDSEFQKRVQQALEDTILNLQNTKTARNGKEANAGAVVVIDVETGGILAYANYPSYDLTLLSSNYTEYSTDPNLPLLNRAFQGQYMPGSSFKPAVAIAGLTEGLITPTSTPVACGARYTFYDPNGPRCEHINHGYGSQPNLYSALQNSCNTYFYDLGRRLGVDAVAETARKLGLGTATGVEIAEATGRLTSTEDSNYTNGIQLMNGIGQGNTMLTPVQLATYAATIANKGVRYQTHLISGYRDTNTGELLESFDPVVMDTISNDNGAFDAVEEGMILAAKSYYALNGYPLNIAAKTGSPQRSELYKEGQYYLNSAVIAYGPVEDSKIAIGAIIEYGGGGANLIPLVKEIFNAYYFEQTGGFLPVQEGDLLA